MNLIKKLLLLGVAGFVASAGIAFAQVATVYQITGTVTATAGTAPARTLRLGDKLNAGDAIQTGANASLVMGFLDGQAVVLAADTAFKIDAYSYNRAEPEKSNVLLSLLDGGMRAITGIIGKVRPQQVNYRVGNATIGIRGTIVDTAIKNKITTAIVQVEVDPVTGKSLATSIVVTFDGSRTVSIPAGNGFYVDDKGQIQVKPAADVIKGLNKSAVEYVVAAILNTATNDAVKRALAQAFKDSGATGIKPPTTTSTPSNNGNNSSSGSSGASGSGGGSASTR